MIPVDLAARLRLLTESAVNPVSPVHEVAGELPELTAGQRFTARIEAPLPDGSFRALVAGRSLTLALPETAAPGDTLELVVTARTPRLVVARQADESAAAQSAPSSFSRAAQLIGVLLAGGERAPQAAAIARATPLLPAPPQQAAQLAPALQQAIEESGLFYEAHQAQWVAGRYPAAVLAREPQSRHAAPRPTPAATAAQPAAEATVPETGAEAAAPRSTAAPALPAELQSMVQQQLDALVTQHVVWRGDIWPGQPMQWEIAPDAQQQNTADEPAAAQWTTRLRLTLPRLGELDVALALAPEKVSLAMTATAQGAATLQQGMADLSDAYRAAGLPPLIASVGLP